MSKKYLNLVWFLIIAFLLPLLSILLQSMISNSFINLVLYGIQAASPTISAIVILCLNKEVRLHFSTIFKKGHLKVAIFLPLSIACITMFGAKLIFCVVFEKTFTLGNISTSQLIIILWALVAEEIGWRGYLEPTLKTCGVPKKVLPCVVGTIWCLWHYHLFIRNGISVPIPLFFISCIIESYLYTFIMNATRNNIVSAMTYHFLWNFFIHLTAINPIENNGSVFPYVILIVLEVSVLFVLLIVRRAKIINNKIKND